MAKPAGFDYRLEPLDVNRHDRSAFVCGIESLDLYLKTLATQDMRRKANAVFVLTAAEAPRRIMGYFTLCAFSLDQAAVPETARRHLPRHPMVSATLIGRLAVAQNEQGRGLGSLMLARALRKAWENAAQVGSCMVIVDAIDDAAEGFYRAHGFIRLPDTRRLILPMRTIGDFISQES